MSVPQLVEYLGATRALANATIDGIVQKGEPVMLLAVRPEPIENFHPHTLVITETQACRLLIDLQTLLSEVLPPDTVARLAASQMVE